MDDMTTAPTRAAPDPALDRITESAALALNAPTALLTRFTADRQVFVSAAGARGVAWHGRSTPLTHSVCRRAARGGAVLAIDDMRRQPAFEGHPAIDDLGVIGYLGAPVIAATPEDDAVLCVLDTRPRRWTGAQCRLIATLAQAVEAELALRALHEERDRLFTSLSHEIRTPLNGVLGGLSLFDAAQGEDERRRFLAMIRASAEELLAAATSVLEEMAARRAMTRRR